MRSYKILDCLNNQQATKPVWLFRQAGRYLPEYIKLRQKQKDFLLFCYTPELCIQAVMQPLERFDLDAAIVFSDILVVPDALGQKVWFEGGVGPRLIQLPSGNLTKDISLQYFHKHLDPVYQAIRGMVECLHGRPLIGFSGAPWTLACYMIEGQGSRDFFSARYAAINDPSFPKLITILEKSVIEYLKQQINAGVQIIQLFDSWAGVLSPTLFNLYVVEPTERIVTAIKKEYPDIPIIGFARQAHYKNTLYAEKTGLTAISLDETIPLDCVEQKGVLQGNLDPVCLLGSEENLYRMVQDWKQKTADRPWIYNLGHGIHKDTDPKKVEKMVKWIRED